MDNLTRPKATHALTALTLGTMIGAIIAGITWVVRRNRPPKKFTLGSEIPIDGMADREYRLNRSRGWQG